MQAGEEGGTATNVCPEALDWTVDLRNEPWGSPETEWREVGKPFQTRGKQKGETIAWTLPRDKVQVRRTDLGGGGEKEVARGW